MSHELLLHRATLALCRASGWAGDWRDLCAQARHEFDQARWDADGGDAKLLAHLGPEPKNYGVDWREWSEKASKARRGYWIIHAEKRIRMPPLPFYSALGSPPPTGCCRVCGQPIYAKRSWNPKAGPRHKTASWHALCFSAFMDWTKPGNIAGYLAARQKGLCAYSGAVIARWVELAPNDWRRGPNPYPKDSRWRGYRPRTHEWRVMPDVEVDHYVPLWRVARMIVSWPRVLDYWGVPNLRAVTSTAHKAKSRREAGERARLRLELADQGEFYV